MPARKGGHEVFCGNWENGVDKRCDERYNLSCVCGRSSSGRARPCQGRGSEFEPRRPLQKEYPIRQDGVFFLECAAAPENSLPRPARSASNPEVKAGLLRMALPFVGCREASSSLVYFAVQSAKTKEKPSDRMGYSFWNAAGRMELAASTSAHQQTDCCRISRRAACPQVAAVYRRCLRLPRVKPFRRGRRPRRPVSAAVPRWERIPTPLRAAKQVPLGDSSE